MRTAFALLLSLLASAAHAGVAVYAFGIADDATCTAGCEAPHDDDLLPLGVALGYALGERYYIEPQAMLLPMLGGSINIGTRAAGFHVSAGAGGTFDGGGGDIHAVARQRVRGTDTESTFWQVEAGWRGLFVRYVSMDMRLKATIDDVGIVSRSRVDLDRDMVFIGYRHEF